MSLLWTIPVFAVIASTVLVLVQLRSISAAAGELGDSLRRLDEVRGEVAEIRSRTASFRGHLDRTA